MSRCSCRLIVWILCPVVLVLAGEQFWEIHVSLAAASDHFESTGKQEFTIPATGQGLCYDTAREIPCPKPGEPYYGQDGNYADEPMSFADNGDGTVTDKTTGLIWQKQDDGIPRNWKAAVGYCDDLSLGGHDDWRLPSKKELISIIDYGRTDPAINADYFPDTKRGWYWTSTLRAIDTYYAWSIFSANGRIHGNHISGGTPFANPGRVFGGLKSGDFYARCVRGGLP
jgi:hypothetical protein